MEEQDKKNLLVIAVAAHDPNQDDDLEAQEAVDTAPDISAQLAVKRGERFEVLGRDVDWWLYVKHLGSEEKGYIPSTCVVPLKDDLTNEEGEELDHNVELTAALVNSGVDLKFFPEAPAEKDAINRGPCPEEKANIFSKLTFWWLNGLILKGFKRPLVNDDLWALGKNSKSITIVPKFMEKWAKEEERCAIGKRCPLEEQQEQETAKLDAEENDETKVEFVPKEDEKKKDKKKEKKKKASLLRAMAYQFGPQFLIGMLLKLIYDVVQFLQPQLMNMLISYTQDSSQETWKGYVYGFSMFLVSVFMSVIIHQYWQIVFVLGMRIRTALIGMIYAKALALNSRARTESTAGEMVNLMSVDAQRLMDLTTYANVLWSSPLTILIALYFLYDAMGPSILAGVGVLVLLIPFNLVVSRIARKLQVKQMEAKDLRIKMVNEILSGIKVLKLYAWETSFMEKVSEIRQRELRQLKHAAYLNASFTFTFTCAPFLVALATFAIYVLTGNELTANKAFVALSLFNILRYPITMFPNVIISMIQGQVSINRLSHFLNLEELNPNNVEKAMPEHISSQAIHVEDGSFSWDKEDSPVLQGINMNIPSGSLVAVVGQVGCGKTTLLSALLGETEKLSGKVYVKGSVAYVPQQAWIQNATLRDNILFGRSFDPKRYCKTISSCALRTDLDILPGGDMTEIGEKGINLSGGQKQRISLARAMYFDADVYLLDDPLSAVDSHVGKHIFDKVIGPRGKLRKKTRIFVTHGVGFLPQVDQIIVLQDGRISEVGTYTELLRNEGAFSEFLKTFASERNAEENEAQRRTESVLRDVPENTDGIDLNFHRSDSPLERTDSVKDGQPSRRKRANSLSVATIDTADLDCHEDKIIEEEKSETGLVKFAVFWAYAKSVKVYLAIGIVLFIVVAEIASVASGIWLARWSSASVTSDDERDMHLEVYGGLGFLQALSMLIAALCLAVGSNNASRHLHQSSLVNVMHSPMSFF